MKKIYVLLITTIIFFAACQPTPEELVVQNKGDDDLKKAILETPNPNQTNTVSNSESNELTNTDVITNISETRTNEQGTVVVDINGSIKFPDDNSVVVARLEESSFTQSQVDKVIESYFGNNNTYYETDFTSKEDVEDNILALKVKLTYDDERLLEEYRDKGYTNVSEIKNHIDTVISEQVKLLESTPEKRPILTDALNIDNGISAKVDYGEEKLGHISCQNNKSNKLILCHSFGDYQGGRFLVHSTSELIEFDTSNSEMMLAKSSAEALISSIGIEGVQVGDIFISQDNILGHSKNAVYTDRLYYVFCFERIVGNRTLDYSFYDGASSDDDYYAPVPYEKIEVWVENNKIVKFLWKNPTHIRDIVNENTAIQVDYNQAIDLAVNHLFYAYAYSFENQYAESVECLFEKIEFDMVRIREKDSMYYITVPAWEIYGDITIKLTPEQLEKQSKYINEEEPDDNVNQEYISYSSCSPNIVTVNALDGTIIDREQGY